MSTREAIESPAATSKPAADSATLKVKWDGKDYPYRPGREVMPDGAIQLHRDGVKELDPITFEVLSNRLWNINEEHADTIQRVSGSPVVVHNYDFNTCIQTEDGEPFLFAPYIQYFTGAAELVIRYTLENRVASPGINDGDIFIANDPLIAGSHQMDVAIYAPVFIDGELFCWVFNAAHARDVGGVEPSSFCIQAPNHYYEAPSLRAVKIADTDGLRADIEDTYLRFSRLPHLLALELRSQIAGVVRARTRIQELCREYLPAVVKGTMKKLIDDAEKAVSERLRRVPDGKWTDIAYVGGALPGDRKAHRMVLTLEKTGDRLRFDNAGTDPQVGSINCGYGQLRAGIGAALAYMLAYDHKFCVGGVFRKTEIDADIGTISAADRDGAISSTQAQLHVIFMAGKVLAKMMYPDPEMRRSVMAASSTCSNGFLTHSGTDQYGAVFATITLDHTAGGVGAFSFRDGIDQGGTPIWPKSEIPDVEAWEEFFPVLYLYRRGALNGGHGKYRGGNGIAFALVGHRTKEQAASTISIASALTTEAGIFGGHWGDTCAFYGAVDTNVREVFAEGVVPASPAEIRELRAQSARRLEPKVVGHPLGETDVVEEAVFGAGGYGDPLERDPELVAEDVRHGRISVGLAWEVYGVKLRDNGSAVDEAATDERRETVLSERLEHAVMPTGSFDAPAGFGELVADIAERLAVVEVAGSLVVECSRCHHRLCGMETNYKDASARLDTSLMMVDPDVFTDPALELDEPVVYRMFICPSCGISFENELTLESATPYRDISWTSASVAADGRDRPPT
jgi:N-methylhydantoinase B